MGRADDQLGRSMRKLSTLIVLIAIVLPLYGCVNTSPIIPDGKWYSDDPNMYIEFGVQPSESVSDIATPNANIGEVYYGDGSSQKIEFAYLHGDFHIYKADSETYEELFTGEYKLQENVLTLYVNDGSEIVLIRQE